MEIKTILNNLIKITLGFIGCKFISLFINFLIGSFLSSFIDLELIQMEEAATSLKSFIVIYSPIIVISIIIGVFIFIDYKHQNKKNVYWKMALLAFYYLEFELNIIMNLWFFFFYQ